MIARSSVWEVIGTDLCVFESDALRAKRLIRRYLAQMDGSAAAQ
jgi:hypothetical protein